MVISKQLPLGRLPTRDLSRRALEFCNIGGHWFGQTSCSGGRANGVQLSAPANDKAKYSLGKSALNCADSTAQYFTRNCKTLQPGQSNMPSCKVVLHLRFYVTTTLFRLQYAGHALHA